MHFNGVNDLVVKSGEKADSIVNCNNVTVLGYVDSIVNCTNVRILPGGWVREIVQSHVDELSGPAELVRGAMIVRLGRKGSAKRVEDSLVQSLFGDVLVASGGSVGAVHGKVGFAESLNISMIGPEGEVTSLEAGRVGTVTGRIDNVGAGSTVAWCDSRGRLERVFAGARVKVDSLLSVGASVSGAFVNGKPYEADNLGRFCLDERGVVGFMSMHDYHRSEKGKRMPVHNRPAAVGGAHWGYVQVVIPMEGFVDEGGDTTHAGEFTSVDDLD